MANPGVIKPYLEWKAKVADMPRNGREILTSSYPYMAAAREVLPKVWPLDRLVELALGAKRQTETEKVEGNRRR